MRRSLITTLPLLAAAACSTSPTVTPIGERDEIVAADDDNNDDDDSEKAPRLDVGSGARWRCIGPPSEDGQHTVVRIALQLGDSFDDDATATVTHGPQFARHGLETLDPTTSAPTEVWTFRLVADVARTVAHLEGEGRVLRLKTAAHTGLATAVLSDDGVDVDLDCWDAAALSSSVPATYDDDVGHCVNEAGEAARNTIPVAVVRETGFGECVDFGEERINANDFGYPLFVGWNLRGANLDVASMAFANLIDVDLRGAQFSQFAFGYVEIDGTIDEATAPPDFCTVEDDQISCRQ